MSSQLTISTDWYQYTALESANTIRLLKILPERLNGKIACTLEHVPEDKLSTKPYSALSYVWGDPDKKQIIYLGNADGDKTMYKYGIPLNLWGFLDQLSQDGYKEESLWADFLCLDQNPGGEKQQQIPRMGKIFSEATRTIAWLGRPLATSKPTLHIGSAIEFISEKWLPNKQEIIKQTNFPSISLSKIKNCNLAEDVGWDPESLRTIRNELALGALQIHMPNILNSPYWKRIWIIQEVTLAKKVVIKYEKYSIDFQQFSLAYRSYVLHYKYTWANWKDSLEKTPAIEARECMVAGNLPLWDILSWSQDCESSDPADRLYGLLGFLKYGAETAHLVVDIKVDYNKALSDIYWDVAFGCRLPTRPESMKPVAGRTQREAGEADNYDNRLYLDAMEECRSIPDYEDKFVMCWIILTSLRKGLRCAGNFEGLEKRSKSANKTPRQEMALVALRLASACRDAGNLCGHRFFPIDDGPRSLLGGWNKVTCLGNILLWVFLHCEGGRWQHLNNAETVQAGIIGVLAELEQRLKETYTPGRWECRAPNRIKSWPDDHQSVIRLEIYKQTEPRCCLHGEGQGQHPEQKCERSPLFLHLSDLNCVLKFDPKTGEGNGILAIAVGNTLDKETAKD